MSSTTFSALQEKYSKVEETLPPAAAPATPEVNPTPPAAAPEAPVVPAAEVKPPETPVVPETPTENTNGEVTDTADFSLSFEEEGGQTSQPATPAAPSFNIDEELKKIDRKTLLQKLGVNDFIIGMDEHYSRGGKIDDYVYAKGVDYNQVSDEDLVKEDYRKRFPSFSKEEIDRMYNRKFGVSDEMNDEEVQDRLLELKAEGHVKRQAKIAEQQAFKIPEPVKVTDDGYEQWKQQNQNAKQQFENQVNFYINHAATKTLNESKRVAINLGDGVPPLKIVVDKPELITRAMTDDGTIMNKLMSTQTGEPDVAKEQLFTLFAFNPQKFIQTIFNYGMQQGVYKKLVNENQNAQKPSAPVLPMSPDAKPVFRNSTFGAMANR